MPELPEVETLTQSLSFLQGRSLKSIEVHFPKLRDQLAISDLCEVKDVKLIRCYRRAKYMIWQLSDMRYLVFHLGMSGTVRRRSLKQKHDHLSFLIDSEVYVYNDPRRFGMVWLVEDIDKFFLDKKIGIEPLSDKCNGQYLYENLMTKKGTIKSVLFQQSLIAGLGNIYINEALFTAKILPQRPANSLTADQCCLLISAIKECLRQAIEKGGSTLSDFHHLDGEKGWFQNCHLVYNKKVCSVCKSEITKEVLTQRSTYYCQNCQS